MASRSSGAVPWPWAGLAACESGGDWADTAGEFEGGVQFLNSSWLTFRAPGDPPHAYQASASAQVAAAERYRAYEQAHGRGGYGPWPRCARQLGLPT